MYIICGLGNPGKEYEQTRHNMGFLTMDVLAYKLGIDIRKLKFRSLIGEGRIGTEKVILVKPQTYMNNSGEALREILCTVRDGADSPVFRQERAEPVQQGFQYRTILFYLFPEGDARRGIRTIGEDFRETSVICPFWAEERTICTS